MVRCRGVRYLQSLMAMAVALARWPGLRPFNTLYEALRESSVGLCSGTLGLLAVVDAVDSRKRQGKVGSSCIKTVLVINLCCSHAGAMEQGSGEGLTNGQGRLQLPAVHTDVILLTIPHSNKVHPCQPATSGSSATSYYANLLNKESEPTQERSLLCRASVT